MGARTLVSRFNSAWLNSNRVHTVRGHKPPLKIRFFTSSSSSLFCISLKWGSYRGGACLVVWRVSSVSSFSSTWEEVVSSLLPSQWESVLGWVRFFFSQLCLYLVYFSFISCLFYVVLSVFNHKNMILFFFLLLSLQWNLLFFECSCVLLLLLLPHRCRFYFPLTSVDYHFY